MVRDPADTGDTPALQDVLSALDDPDCRAILREASEPMTAAELTDTCDISKSTVYRKLDRLSQASLVRERIEVHPEGGRITRYERDVTDVTISVDDDEEFSVAIDRPARGVDEGLADMWSKMGGEI
ncbi:winged helix-turn-helix domain-containing protein [Natrialba sp. SSL1]|uniref:winged helix-turn-helix domain-containing protein n=1 Tax=Natrialba sp. SSL1 TaxID=1869245 RepID=UPI0008F97040|nr:helix-turn-helix domain-containing protein [Natrialba sp. SSL1]OIB57352.1 transcriptional regulator TrmB [Natrialba sp. SSL1]